jgi:small subunit ribosomal protein S18
MAKKIVKRKYRKEEIQKLTVGEIDYKRPETFKDFLTPSGKIKSRELTGISMRDQRKISNAIKNAREMALIPYSVLIRSEK